MHLAGVTCENKITQTRSVSMETTRTARKRKKEESEVTASSSFLLTFFLIAALHLAAILLFTRGFLLTRTELPFYSNCSDLSQSPCAKSPSQNQTQSSSHCWTKPAVNRLVIIVFDALRFDFVAPSTFFEEKQPWMDKFKVMHKVASEKGHSAKIFKAIADPPTTSLQRLKGLTTGGLPTFIDVGNSFGAPAIVEDNLLYQLAQNGKRVVMMGDDTWLQLFPHHFNRSYPFPSFNVKDLDTVDDGCVKHLFPSLLEDDWDVLVAHFLGVDHAGHIFGVNSDPMIGKLEQYNSILQKIIDVLESHSGPDGLHENTLLLVMGDHGQTVNGDHGGGGPEEVETAIFAMGFKKPPGSLPPEYDTSACRQDLEGKLVCYSSIEQLEFAVTVSALLGISFPFGSIGRVNPELYALSAGTWNYDDYATVISRNQLALKEWMLNYINVLCVNSWQVKRYIDVYSASSLVGFSKEDLLHLSAIYTQATEKQSHTVTCLDQRENGSEDAELLDLRSQIDSHFSFLATVAELSRSKWTEFNLGLMGFGLAMMLISLLVHLHFIRKLERLYTVYSTSCVKSGISFGLAFSCLIVAVRACSFLANSYILEEGKVACFLAATLGILIVRHSVMEKKMLVQAVGFTGLISILRFSIELKLSKQDFSSALLNLCPSWMFGFVEGHIFWTHVAELIPLLFLLALGFMLHYFVARKSCNGILKDIIIGTQLCYVLIAVYWASDMRLLNLHLLPEEIRKHFLPWVIYGIGCAQLLALILFPFLSGESTSKQEDRMISKAVAMLSVWSSTVIILSGRQGVLVALASVFGGWCIVRSKNSEQDSAKSDHGTLALFSFPVTQWSLAAVCLFFSTGHWCAFDGLHYAAPFIGFEEFTLIPQAVLLIIETFGFSHILPVLGLPFLVGYQHPFSWTDKGKQMFYIKLSQIYSMYGLITATTFTVTMICVTIQRRHLMVWGLFAPKFVFDVVALVLTDALIFLAMFYYGKIE